MKHALFLAFGLILAGCGLNDDPKPKTTHISGILEIGKDRPGHCIYAMDDGSEVDVDFGVLDCPKHWDEEVDAEAP